MRLTSPRYLKLFAVSRVKVGVFSFVVFHDAGVMHIPHWVIGVDTRHDGLMDTNDGYDSRYPVFGRIE